MNFALNYLSQFRETLDDLPVGLINQVITLLHEARMHQRTIFIMGNGGSASTATHFAADLGKNTRKQGWPNFKVMGLADNMASITAYANDEGYDRVFVNQLASFVQPRDVVIAISASGNSPNVLRAIELARQVGAVTIGFTGFQGGVLGTLVDYHLHVPSNVIEQVEDIHLMFEHMIVRALRDHVEEIQVEIEPQISLSASQLRSPHELVYAFSRELEGNLAPQDLLRRALQISLEALGAMSGSIMFFNEQGEVADAALAYGGQVQKTDLRQLSETVENGLAGWVVANRQAALVESTQNDPRWLPREWEQAQSIPRSAVSVPLMERDRVLGVLTLVHTRAGQFNRDHLVLMSTIAILISFAAVNLAHHDSEFRH